MLMNLDEEQVHSEELDIHTEVTQKFDEIDELEEVIQLHIQIVELDEVV